MVGDAEKVVAVAAVPVGDHLGIVVAIAPERVSVEVALPPAGVFGGEGGGAGTQNEPGDGQSQPEDGRDAG